eukprot:9096313-Pyramimonas_sp.AAC.1
MPGPSPTSAAATPAGARPVPLAPAGGMPTPKSFLEGRRPSPSTTRSPRPSPWRMQWRTPTTCMPQRHRWPVA